MENKTNNEIIAEALIRIIKNQIDIKKHLGVARDTTYYGDCHDDYRTIEELRYVG